MKFLPVVVAALAAREAAATSFKMDFLSAGTVRTDPLMFNKIGNCLSDHVHRFYGAVSPRTMRPDVTYADLRSATGNTGNVEENKSLYWNPAIYQVRNANTDQQSFELVDIWFASAYYIFRTGTARAFPAGLKMKASGANAVSRAVAECAGPYPCERNDGCQAYGPSNQGQTGFLPTQGCGELEINIKFPTCWDGQNKESDTGDHVVYSTDCGTADTECFEGDCPSSHPVKLPELHLYVRVLGYEGGAHMFADGTDIFHSDYFSGWDESELQRVLDNCENESEAANPDAFCSDWLTFRGKGKTEGEQVDDDTIVSDLNDIQPPAVDTRATISPEAVTNVPQVPSGVCTGTLIPDGSEPPAPPGTTDPSQPSTPQTPKPTTSQTPTSTTEAECVDNWNWRKCAKKERRGKCNKKKVKENCRDTCTGGTCQDEEEESRESEESGESRESGEESDEGSMESGESGESRESGEEEDEGSMESGESRESAWGAWSI